MESFLFIIIIADHQCAWLGVANTSFVGTLFSIPASLACRFIVFEPTSFLLISITSSRVQSLTINTAHTVALCHATATTTTTTTTTTTATTTTTTTTTTKKQQRKANGFFVKMLVGIPAEHDVIHFIVFEVLPITVK